MMDAEEEDEKIKKKKKPRFDEPRVSLENLPFDSVMETEILPRLPLKSIVQLEFASKPLSPFISDHLRRHYSLPNAVSGIFFSSPYTPAKNFYHALDNNKFVIDGTITTLPRSDDLAIVDCCNGLLLCRWQKINEGVVPLICNPLTGQFASIPYSSDSFDNAVLAFDPRISGHYNILRFGSGNIEVFSSETDNWVQKKQAASHMARVGKGYPFFFNGKIYFQSNKSPFVKIFDLQGRSVGRINLPHSVMPFTVTLLGHSGGHLHLAVLKEDEEMLVWILDKSRWVLKHRVNLRSLFGAGSSTWDRCSSYPQAFHPDMDVVFIKVKDKLFSYNMDNGDLAEVCTYLRERQLIFVYSPCYSKDFDL